MVYFKFLKSKTNLHAFLHSRFVSIMNYFPLQKFCLVLILMYTNFVRPFGTNRSIIKYNQNITELHYMRKAPGYLSNKTIDKNQQITN